MQPEIKILKEALKCRCGQPFDEHMLMSDQVKICTVCDDVTCVRCWANTDQREYLRAEIRGQTICKSCYNALGERLFIKCPSCGQTLRDYYDMKICAGWCRRMICPSCGIPGQVGQLVCRKDHPKYVSLMEVLRS
jgi:hypothetical protein